MIPDLVTSLFTSISPHLRSLGYLDEALAMQRRYRRRQNAWRSHLENTRRFVLSAAEQCRNRSTVVILGSGLLLDVPLEELSASFEQVVLQDVVCLPAVRKRIKRCRNVRFVERDVTCISEGLYRNRQQGICRLPEVSLLPDDCSDAGLIVSLNILSQLWVVPRSYAARNLRGLGAHEIDDWCCRIVEAHHDWLRSRPCDVCLVADREYLVRDRTGRIVNRGSSVYGLDLPWPDEEWTWSIMPLGKESSHSAKELIVGAWHFPGTAGSAGRENAS